MASIKVKYRPSSVEGKEGTVYYQIIHNRVVRQLNTDYKIFVSEWYTASETIIINPASREKSERDNYLLSVNESIKIDKERLDRIIVKLQESGTAFTSDDVVSRFHNSDNEQSFSVFMGKQIARLKRLGKIRTSETYTATLNSFMRFLGNKEVLLSEFNADLIAEYEAYLRGNGNTPNTVSFYMRILRAVYNRAVEKGLAVQTHPFKSVYTGVEKTLKRAISLGDLKCIKALDLSLKPGLDFARDIFLFCFYTRGMSFVDIAYLRKTDLANGVLSYRRKKTNQLLHIKWEKCMQEIIDKYPANETEFLLPIITNPDSDYRRQYSNALHRVNSNLKVIGEMVNLPLPLTMYCGRHSWCSIAKSRNVPISVISEAMGHDSEATTQIYLASLDTAVVDRANRQILNLL